MKQVTQIKVDSLEIHEIEKQLIISITMGARENSHDNL